jgi:hypothetical protein
MNGGVVNNPCPEKGNAVLWIKKRFIIVSGFYNAAYGLNNPCTI